MADHSFVNNFWGPDTRGMTVVQQRMAGGTTSTEELLRFYKARAQIERDYAKRLADLALQPTGSGEVGTMRQALDSMRHETRQQAEHHTQQAAQVAHGVHDPLEALLKRYNEQRRGIELLVAQVRSQYERLQRDSTRLRQAYADECGRYKLVRAEMLLALGAEHERLLAKISKHHEVMNRVRQQYFQLVSSTQQWHEQYVLAWQVALQRLEMLDRDRVVETRKHMWEYTNAVSTACVSDADGAEEMRTMLEKVDPVSDSASWVAHNKTGTEVYEAEPFVDYAKGESDATARRLHRKACFNTETVSKTVSPQLSKTPTSKSSKPSHHRSQSLLSAKASSRQVAVSATGSPVRRQHRDSDPFSDIQLTSEQPPQAGGATEQAWAVPSLDPSSVPALSAPPHSRALQSPTLLVPPHNISKGSATLHDLEDVRLLHYLSSVFDEQPTRLEASGYTLTLNTLQRLWALPSRRLRLRLRPNSVVIDSAKSGYPTTAPNVPSAKSAPATPAKPKVALSKDFSMTFDPLTTALDDLARGGNGDMNQFRKLVRALQLAPTTPASVRPVSGSLSATGSNATVAGADSTPRLTRLRGHSRSRRSCHSLADMVVPQVCSNGAPVISCAVAQFAFEAMDPETDTSIAKGDRLLVYEKMADLWIGVENLRTGHWGTVPGNYVKMGANVF